MTIEPTEKVLTVVGDFLYCILYLPVLLPINGIILGKELLTSIPYLFSSEGKKTLTEETYVWKIRFKDWQVVCLLTFLIAACCTPVFFAMSLILRWHVAVTIAFGIVAPLMVLGFVVDYSYDNFKKESKKNKNEINRKINLKYGRNMVKYRSAFNETT